MKLKDKSSAPIGGWFYDVPETGDRLWSDVGYDKLIRGVKEWYALKGIDEPELLKELIEDQICTRQPSDRCFYTKGFGDRIAQTIHKVARVVDKVAGTKLEKKARGCSKCSQRRVRINISR
jgi:hypothetical protein